MSDKIVSKYLFFTRSTALAVGVLKELFSSHHALLAESDRWRLLQSS